MFALYIILITVWLLVILFAVTQVIYPMFSDVEFFWIFKWQKIKKKHKDELDKMYENRMEKEITEKFSND